MTHLSLWQQVKVGRLLLMLLVVSALVGGLAGWFTLTRNLKNGQMREVAAAGIAASVSLIFALLSRSTSISDRVRALSREIQDIEDRTISRRDPAARALCIKNQLSLLGDRYTINLIAATLQVCIVPLLAILYLTIPDKTADESATWQSVTLVVVCIVLLSVGFVNTVFDLMLSVNSLGHEHAFAVAAAEYVNNHSETIPPDRTEIIVHASERYQEIYYDLRLALDAKESLTDEQKALEARNYYVKFWGLQRDQFSFWRHYMIPDHLMAEWMEVRRRQFRSRHHAVMGLSFSKGWNSVKSEFDDRHFKEMVTRLKSPTNHQSVFEILVEIRKQIG